MMKKVLIGVAVAAVAAVVFAAQQNNAKTTSNTKPACCAEKATAAKTQLGKTVASTQASTKGKADACGTKCDDKIVASTTAKAGSGCCGAKMAGKTVASTQASTKGKADACGAKCDDKIVASKTVNGKEACCKSTAAKPMAKGDKGCCNNANELAKFKVFVDGEWKYFGCKGSAEKGRAEWVTKAFNVGPVQPVVGKITIAGKRVA